MWVPQRVRKMKKEYCFILDISRLLSRAGQSVPTGIDRVELAYAEHLLTHYEKQTHFVSATFYGRINFLPRKKTIFFIQLLLSGWNFGSHASISKSKRLSVYLKIISSINFICPKIEKVSFYFLLSHHHLTRRDSIQKFIRNSSAYFIPMVHDIIPIEYPEYSRPREKLRHRKRIDTVLELANAVIVPTNYVKKSLSSLLDKERKHNVPIWSIPHGVYERKTPIPHEENISIKIHKPYFVYLSTIEPRKNHLLLLHIWRKMIEDHGKESTPHLVLVGKRGWENENILDLLERSPALQGIVHEKSHLSDRDVVTLLKQSNGLLFPSFSEGYGLPLAEAISLSVPCICSDIPALREVGKDLPFYLDPLDALKWREVISDFARKGPLWKKQKESLKNWQPFPWSDSIETAIFLCITSNEKFQ